MVDACMKLPFAVRKGAAQPGLRGEGADPEIGSAF